MLGPLLLRPIVKPRVWGGRRLAGFGIDLPARGSFGEAWLLADLPASIEEGRSVVESGPFAGEPLRAVLDSHRSDLLGTAESAADGGFPLLVKLLDARENLSVQVHPTPTYAWRHPGAQLKSEAWVVLEADPGAVLYLDLRPGLDAAAIRGAARDGSIVDDLVAVPARVGECHYLPSGTCHALGAGVLVAEVQTPSDTTFRLYDWGRSGRELHVDAAIECILDPTAEPAPRGAPATTSIAGCECARLCATPHFSIERIRATGDTEFRLDLADRPVVLLWLAPDGAIAAGGAVLHPCRGRAAILPACLEEASIRLPAGGELLRIDAPPPGAAETI